MLGKVKRTSRGFQYIPFFDHNGQECSLQQSSLAMYEPPGTSAIWLGVDENKPSNRMHLTLDMVKDLMSVLQNWVDTGYFDQETPSGLTSGSTLTGGGSPGEGDADNQSSAVTPAGR